MKKSIIILLVLTIKFSVFAQMHCYNNRPYINQITHESFNYYVSKSDSINFKFDSANIYFTRNERDNVHTEKYEGPLESLLQNLRFRIEINADSVFYIEQDSAQRKKLLYHNKIDSTFQVNLDQLPFSETRDSDSFFTYNFSTLNFALDDIDIFYTLYYNGEQLPYGLFKLKIDWRKMRLKGFSYFNVYKNKIVEQRTGNFFYKN